MTPADASTPTAVPSAASSSPFGDKLPHQTRRRGSERTSHCNLARLLLSVRTSTKLPTFTAGDQEQE